MEIILKGRSNLLNRGYRKSELWALWFLRDNFAQGVAHRFNIDPPATDANEVKSKRLSRSPKKNIPHFKG
jgi:hypothetical protein